MADNSGNRFSISIDGNAAGPVVAGNHNRVGLSQEPTPAESEQTNTGHGTVFAVTNGDLHVHQASEPK